MQDMECQFISGKVEAEGVRGSLHEQDAGTRRRRINTGWKKWEGCASCEDLETFGHLREACPAMEGEGPHVTEVVDEHGKDEVVRSG